MLSDEARQYLSMCWISGDTVIACDPYRVGPDGRITYRYYAAASIDAPPLGSSSPEVVAQWLHTVATDSVKAASAKASAMQCNIDALIEDATAVKMRRGWAYASGDDVMITWCERDDGVEIWVPCILRTVSDEVLDAAHQDIAKAYRDLERMIEADRADLLRRVRDAAIARRRVLEEERMAKMAAEKAARRRAVQTISPQDLERYDAGAMPDDELNDILMRFAFIGMDDIDLYEPVTADDLRSVGCRCAEPDINTTHRSSRTMSREVWESEARREIMRRLSARDYWEIVEYVSSCRICGASVTRHSMLVSRDGFECEFAI